MNVKIGNKAKKILAGVTLASVLLTSMPIDAFASGNNSNTVYPSRLELRNSTGMIRYNNTHGD